MGSRRSEGMKSATSSQSACLTLIRWQETALEEEMHEGCGEAFSGSWRVRTGGFMRHDCFFVRDHGGMWSRHRG